MTSMFRRPIIIAAVVAMGLLVTSAHADMILLVQEDGSTAGVSPSQPIVTAGSPVGTTVSAGAPTVTTPDFRIDILGADESQLALSEVTSATVRITNVTGSSGHTLTILFTGTGFTAPTTPPNITGMSHIGGTGPVLTGSPNFNLQFFSQILQANVAPNPPFAPQNVGGPSFNNSETKTITTLTPNGPGGTFSIQEAVTITGLNGNGDNMNFSGSTTLGPTGVPEPSSLAVAALSGVGLISYGLRRRRASGA